MWNSNGFKPKFSFPLMRTVSCTIYTSAINTHFFKVYLPKSMDVKDFLPKHDILGTVTVCTTVQ